MSKLIVNFIKRLDFEAGFLCGFDFDRAFL